MRRKHMGGLITLPPFRKPVGSLGLKRVDRFAQEQSVGLVKIRQNLFHSRQYCKNCIGSTADHGIPARRGSHAARQTSRECSTAAAMKPANNGCGSNGFDFSSG